MSINEFILLVVGFPAAAGFLLWAYIVYIIARDNRK